VCKHMSRISYTIPHSPGLFTSHFLLSSTSSLATLDKVSTVYLQYHLTWQKTYPCMIVDDQYQNSKHILPYIFHCVLFMTQIAMDSTNLPPKHSFGHLQMPYWVLQNAGIFTAHSGGDKENIHRSSIFDRWLITCFYATE
jgi:hypothetical protein